MKDNVLGEITVTRDKDKTNYKVNCAKGVKCEELAPLKGCACISVKNYC